MDNHASLSPDAAVDPTLHAFIKIMPKAALHFPIEAMPEPRLMYSPAQRNGVVLPCPSAEVLQAVATLSGLQTVHAVLAAGAAILQDEQDFYERMAAYSARVHRKRFLHAGIGADPSTHTGYGALTSVQRKSVGKNMN